MPLTYPPTTAPRWLRAGAALGAIAVLTTTAAAAGAPDAAPATPSVVPVAYSVPMLGAPPAPGDGTVLGDVGTALLDSGAVPPPPAPEPRGDPRETARTLAAERGWGEEQFSCLDLLWEKESSWQSDADNAASSAYGIPQALPGEKMASAGPDWATDPVTQIRWGLQYVADTYDTPCAAWEHSRAVDWY